MFSTRYWHEEKFSERKVSEMNAKKYRDKKWLFQQYSILRRKVKDIADDCGTSADVIYDWLKKYNIKTNRYVEKPDKEILENLYIKELKSTREIAKTLGCSRNAVINWLKKYEIPMRTISESNHNYFKYKGGKKIQSEKVKKDWKNDKYRNLQSEIKKELFKNNPELKIQHSAKMQGIDISEWNGFSELETRRVRKSVDYKNWQNEVFKRDDYTCQCCGKRGGVLHAHHLESFSDNPDLRFDISNGITLCEDCHSPNKIGSFHNMYGTMHNTKDQFVEFLTNYKTYAKTK